MNAPGGKASIRGFLHQNTAYFAKITPHSVKRTYVFLQYILFINIYDLLNLRPRTKRGSKFILTSNDLNKTNLAERY